MHHLCRAESLDEWGNWEPKASVGSDRADNLFETFKSFYDRVVKSAQRDVSVDFARIDKRGFMDAGDVEYTRELSGHTTYHVSITTYEL